ncbi:MAG: monovalent cation/H+ antiporter complex subunit F [Bacteroidota bacterium]|nr:monovalent cation/H+ antiporter complex subunit F [Bacteroidota bacterium]
MANIILYIALGFIGMAAILTFIRFIKGNTSVDRVIALDVLTITSIALIGLISHFTNRVIYLDVALVYGLLSFIAVLVIARYLERGL